MPPRHALLAAALLVGGCGSTSSSSAQGSANGERPFKVQAVATFDAPWAISFFPGRNDALVTEKPGRIWLVDTATGKKQAIAGVPRVVESSQGGLLDVVIAPNYPETGLVYLTFSEPSANGGSGLALARGKLLRRDVSGKLDNVQVLWRDPAGGQGGQFGARIAFAPDGQSLFLSSGERQRFTPAQDMNQPLGKILHLTLDGKPAPDNPWAGKQGASTVQITDPPKDTDEARTTSGTPFRWPGANLTPAETWTLGHRNPLGLAFAADGRLWETEMGPRGGDELNLIVRGANYGYPHVSNGTNYDGADIPDHRPGDGFVAPKVFWNPSISPAGLLIYSGNLFPAWKGDALVPALSGQALIHIRIRGDQATKADRWEMGNRIRAVAQGPNGEVYLLEDGPGARLLRLKPLK
jgi:glucose/arabinose dehydrogenase